MKTVATISGKPPLETLRLLGHRTILIDSHIPLDLMLLADVPLEVELDDWASVERRLRAVHRHTPIDVVLGTKETHLALAAYLADRFGARGLAPHAALNCYDKLRTRHVLASYDIPSPGYAGAVDADEAVAAAYQLGFPIIVKPNDGTGGEGVTLCTDEAAVRAAAEGLIARSAADGRIHQILVEEYLDGPEFSVLAITEDGKTEVVTILEPAVSPPPRFVVVACRCPARLSPLQHTTLANLIASALSALGVDNAVTHTQVRWTADGPKIIEVNTRPPGGQIVRLAAGVTGINLLQAAVEVAVGNVITRQPPIASYALYHSIVFSQAGVLSYREDMDVQAHLGLEGRIPPIIELDVHSGEVVLSISEGGVYGRIVVFGDDVAQIERDYQRVVAALDLKLIGLTDTAVTRAIKKCC
jgi:biotin carboxylase